MATKQQKSEIEAIKAEILKDDAFAIKGRLSERQMPYVKKIAKKYTKQIHAAGIRAEVIG